jgi:N-acetylglutamate synthase-like GNAT family acetyltransferase
VTKNAVEELIAAEARTWGDDEIIITSPTDVAAVEASALIAAVSHTGAMIALVPSGGDAERLAVDGGEDVEQLHTTLAYLGEAALIPLDVREWIVDAMTRCVEGLPTIIGDAFSVSMFNPAGDLTSAFDPKQPRDGNGRWSDVGSNVPLLAGISETSVPSYDEQDAAEEQLRDIFTWKLPQTDIQTQITSVKFVGDGYRVSGIVADDDVVDHDSELTFFVGMRDDRPTTVIDNIVVSDWLRNRGFGKRYVQHIEDELGARGIAAIELYDTNAQGFWESLGYTPVDANYPNRVHKELQASVVAGDLALTAGVKEPCVTLTLSGAQLESIYHRVCDVLSGVYSAAGMDSPKKYVPWIPHITLVYTDDADLSYFTDRVGPVMFDALRVAFGDDVYDIPLGEAPDDDNEITASGELRFTADGEPIVPNVLFDWRAFQKERDVNIPGGPGHNLRNYWVRGPGAAKIRWKTAGDWTRCVAQLGRYVKDPKGLCSEYHKQATGMWPGDKRNPGMNTDVEAFKFDPKQPRDFDGKWTDTPGLSSALSAVDRKKLLKNIKPGAVIGTIGKTARLRVNDKGTGYVVDSHSGYAWDTGYTVPKQYIAKELEREYTLTDEALAAIAFTPKVERTKSVTSRVSAMRVAYDAGYTVDQALTGGISAESVDLITLSDGTKAVKKVLKHNPAEANREMLASRVANALGLNDMIVTIVDDNTVLMSHVEGVTGARVLDERADAIGLNNMERVPFEIAEVKKFMRRPGAKELGVLDWVINNSDRNQGNWLEGLRGEVAPIDHGRARFGDKDFPIYGKVYDNEVPNSPFAEYWVNYKPTRNQLSIKSMAPRLKKTELKAMRTKLQALRGTFTEAGEPEWFEYIMKRLRMLEEAAK